MRHFRTIKIYPSKYLRSFQYGGSQYIFHSLLGNPLRVSEVWNHFAAAVQDGITLNEISFQPELEAKLKLLLEHGLFEYANSNDVLQESIEINRQKISTGELIRLLVLDLHTACNMGCSYCYAAKTQEKHGLKGKAMPFETAKQAIDEFVLLSKKNKKRSAAVSYFGGEPLLNQAVLLRSLEYVSWINKKEKRLRLTQAVTTNGALVTQHHVDAFKEHDCFVAISIDGLQEEHDKLRIYKNGEGTFDRVNQSLKMLIAADVNHEVIITVGVHNTKRLPDFIRYLRSINVGRVSIKGQTYKHHPDEARLQISQAVMSGLKLAEEIGILAKKGPGDLEFSRGCQGLGGLVCVEPDGEIYPCPEGSRIKLGTVSTFAQIPLADGYRKISSRITGQLEQCSGCEVEGLCRGGCAGESEYLFDDVYKIDPTECESIRATIKRNLALYGHN